MRLHLRILGLEALLDPRDIHASRDQEPAELIVQLARQRGLLLLGERLQVCRELRQLLGALLDELLELGVALREFRGLAFSEAQLPHHESAEEQDETDAGGERSARGGETHPATRLPGLARQQNVGGLGLVDAPHPVVDASHGEHTDVGAHELERRRTATRAIGLERLAHLGELRVHQVFHLRDVRAHRRRRGGERLLQTAECLGKISGGFLERHEIGGAVGQDIATLAAFGLAHELPDIRKGALALRRMLHVAAGLLQTPLTRFGRNE